MQSNFFMLFPEKGGAEVCFIHVNLRQCVVYGRQILRGKLNERRPQIFFQTLRVGRAGNGNNEGPLRQLPGEDNLGGRSLFAFGHIPNEAQQRLIAIHNLRPEAPHETAKVAFSVHGVTSETPAQESVAQRAVGDKGDVHGLAQVEQSLFRFAPHHGILVFHSGQRANGMGALQVVNGRVGKSPPPNFPFLHQGVHGFRNGFRFHIGIHTMLIVEINMVGFESEKGTFHLSANGCGLAVQQIDRLAVHNALADNAEFACQNNLVTKGRERLAEQFLIGFAINNGGIKKVAPKLQSMTEQSYHLLPWGGFAVSMIHAHAAKPDFRNRQAVSQLTLFHVRSLR